MPKQLRGATHSTPPPHPAAASRAGGQQTQVVRGSETVTGRWGLGRLGGGTGPVGAPGRRVLGGNPVLLGTMLSSRTRGTPG